MTEYLDRLMNQYNISVDVGIIMTVIGLGMFIVFIICTIYDIYSMKKREAKYLNNFTEAYYASHDIKKTMEKIRSLYKDREKEAQAIDAGLYYLDHSLLRDYQSALGYMELLFPNGEIKKFHLQCIKDAQAQKCLLLTKLEEELKDE